MKNNLIKSQAKNEIDNFFNKESFSPDQVRKIKRFAMKYNIKLGEYRKRFCKKCLSQLKGKTRITKTHKAVICQNCGYKNKFRL